MFAIIENGGRQYRVEPGDVIDVELKPAAGEADGGVEFDRVLLVSGDSGVQVGNPTLEGARVCGVSLGDARGPKILVFKKKRRKGYKRLRGHRQDLHRVRIEEIKA